MLPALDEYKNKKKKRFRVKIKTYNRCMARAYVEMVSFYGNSWHLERIHDDKVTYQHWRLCELSVFNETLNLANEIVSCNFTTFIFDDATSTVYTTLQWSFMRVSSTSLRFALST